VTNRIKTWDFYILHLIHLKNLLNYRRKLEDMLSCRQSMSSVFHPMTLACNTSLSSCFKIVISFIISLLWVLFPTCRTSSDGLNTITLLLIRFTTSRPYKESGIDNGSNYRRSTQVNCYQERKNNLGIKESYNCGVEHIISRKGL